jgi:threonine/homoserine/homoserine lactone efflux protein
MALAFLLGLVCGFVGSIPAGPTGALVFERGLAGRMREALAIAAGASLAESLYALLAFLGLTAIFARFPWLLQASRLAGAVILAGLGLWFALGKRAAEARGPEAAAGAQADGARGAEAQPAPDAESARPAPDAEKPAPGAKSSKRLALLGHGGPGLLGFVVTAANPTLLVTWSAAVTILHGATGMPAKAANSIPFALGVALGIAGWFATLLSLLHRNRARLSPALRERVIRVLGWFLIGLGVALLAGVLRHL